MTSRSIGLGIGVGAALGAGLIAGADVCLKSKVLGVGGVAAEQ